MGATVSSGWNSDLPRGLFKIHCPNLLSGVLKRTKSSPVLALSGPYEAKQSNFVLGARVSGGWVILGAILDPRGYCVLRVKLGFANSFG